MVDNTTLNSGSGGDVIRDIDRSGVKTQVVQLDAGGDSGESLVSSSNPLPARAPDTYVALNAASITSAAVLGTWETTGYQSFQIQVTGTFNATVLVEISDDNTNWSTGYFYSALGTILPSSVTTSITSSGVNNGYGPVRTRYIRLRCSAFSSNTSSAVTMIFRAAPPPVEYVNVNISGNSLSSISVAPGSFPSSLAIGTTQFIKAAASTNATSVKASAGNIFGLCVVNNSSAVKFLKLYNKASAPTVGTDVPVVVFGIAANGGQVSIDHTWNIPRFSTGIAYAITGAVGDTDTTTVAANDVSGWIVYA